MNKVSFKKASSNTTDYLIVELPIKFPRGLPYPCYRVGDLLHPSGACLLALQQQAGEEKTTSGDGVMLLLGKPDSQLTPL